MVDNAQEMQEKKFLTFYDLRKDDSKSATYSVTDMESSDERKGEAPPKKQSKKALKKLCKKVQKKRKRAKQLSKKIKKNYDQKIILEEEYDKLMVKLSRLEAKLDKKMHC